MNFKSTSLTVLGFLLLVAGALYDAYHLPKISLMYFVVAAGCFIAAIFNRDDRMIL